MPELVVAIAGKANPEKIFALATSHALVLVDFNSLSLWERVGVRA